MNTIWTWLKDNSNSGWKQFGTVILRLLILSIIIFGLVLGFIKVFNFFFPHTSINKIEANGNVINFNSDGKEIYYYLFPTSSYWDEPEIEFETGDEVKISASGKYNSAIHHLVEYGQSDTNMIFEWIGPEGIPYSSLYRRADRIRFQGCLKKDANFGALLVKQILHDTAFIYAYDPKSKNIRLRFNEPGKIKFCVNETPLDSSEVSKNLYIITPKKDSLYPKSIALQAHTWEKIKQENNCNKLWFDDNTGDLFIMIEVTKK